MGSALAHALATQGHPIQLWDIHPAVLDEISHRRTNSRFLPGIPLHRGISTTASPADCVRGASLVAICIPSAFALPVLEPLLPSLEKGAILLNIAKGFAPGGTVPLPVDLQNRIPDHPCVHLAGPAIANDFSKGRQAFVVMASACEPASREVAAWFAGSFFSCKASGDLTGAALGGILKNCYAILLGALSEMQPEICANQEAAVVTACVEEMTALTVSMGGQADTIHGLAGLGDLLATGFSGNSHNRRLGRNLAKGMKLHEVETEHGGLPEGVRATPSALAIAAQNGVSLPLAAWVDSLLQGKRPAIADLLETLR